MHSFKDVIEKRVIPSIQTLFADSQNPKFPQPSILDRELKNLIQTTFGTFFQTLGVPVAQQQQQQQQQQQPISPIPSLQSQSSIPSLMTASPKPSFNALSADTNAMSSFSSFKRQIKSEPAGEADSAVGSGSLSNSFSSIESSESSSFKSYFSSLKNVEQSAQMDVDKPVNNNNNNNNMTAIKQEASNNNDLTFKLETSAQFSDEDDSSNEPTDKISLGKSKYVYATL